MDEPFRLSQRAKKFSAHPLAHWLITTYGGIDYEDALDRCALSLLRRSGQANTTPVLLSSVCECLRLNNSPKFSPGLRTIFDARAYQIRVCTVNGQRPRHGSAEYLRTRFSVAHEIGHAILHERGIAGVRRVAPVCNGTHQEHFCNSFARRLLIPEEPFLLDASQPGVFSVDAMERLADKYRVSLSVIVYRLEGLRGRITGDRSDEISIVSARSRSRNGSGKFDFLCLASFEPPHPKFKGHWFLWGGQPLDRVYRVGGGRMIDLRGSWSLIEFLKGKLPRGESYPETLRHRKHSWRITVELHHEFFPKSERKAMALTTGRITSFD